MYVRTPATKAESDHPWSAKAAGPEVLGDGAPAGGALGTMQTTGVVLEREGAARAAGSRPAARSCARRTGTALCAAGVPAARAAESALDEYLYASTLYHATGYTSDDRATVKALAFDQTLSAAHVKETWGGDFAAGDVVLDQERHNQRCARAKAARQATDSLER